MLCNLNSKLKTLRPYDKLYVPENNDKYLIFICLCFKFIISWIGVPLISFIQMLLPSLYSTYEIKENDTINGISQILGCLPEDILSINPQLQS